jgi:hypothetical protein
VHGADEDRSGHVMPDPSGVPAIDQGLVVREEDDVAVCEAGGAAQEGEQEAYCLEGG